MRMGKKSLILISVSLLGLVAGAVGVYAWDASRDDLIADGVKVGGIDLGGMRGPQARRTLAHDLVQPLSQDLHVKVGKRMFRLTSNRIRLRADLGRMVAEAEAASREGGLPSRTWRFVTGKEMVRSLPPRVGYSTRQLRFFIGEIAAKVDHPARNASVKPSAGALEPVREQVGTELDRRRLRTRLEDELASPAGARLVVAPMRTIKPRVTTAQLARRFPVYILVDRSAYQLRFFKRLKLAKTYRIAVGRQGLRTSR